MFCRASWIILAGVLDFLLLLVFLNPCRVLFLEIFAGFLNPSRVGVSWKVFCRASWILLAGVLGFLLLLVFLNPCRVLFLEFFARFLESFPGVEFMSKPRAFCFPAFWVFDFLLLLVFLESGCSFLTFLPIFFNPCWMLVAGCANQEYARALLDAVLGSHFLNLNEMFLLC